MADSSAGTPRWVKVSLIITAIVVVLFLVLLMFGEGHGPGRHMPSHGLDNHTTVATGVVRSWR